MELEKAYSYDDKGYLTGEANRQLDPLETKLKGEPVYLIPGNATLIKPLKKKKGYKIKFNKDEQNWEYEKEPEEEEPKPYEPTPKELVQQELMQTKYELSQLDYIGVKIATGRATKEEYAKEIQKMNELAAKVDELNEQLANME